MSHGVAQLIPCIFVHSRALSAAPCNMDASWERPHVEQAKDDEPLDSMPKRKPLFLGGAAASFVYVVLVGVWWRDPSPILDLDPNGFGDFLAGTFAPLAFLWLVLGFLQQGQELALQVKELKHSVTAQSELVVATRELRELEAKLHKAENDEAARVAAPILELQAGGSSPAGDGGRKLNFSIENHGRTCTAIKGLLDGHNVLNVPKIETGESRIFGVVKPNNYSGSQYFELTYIDARSVPGSAAWTVSFEGGLISETTRVHGSSS